MLKQDRLRVELGPTEHGRLPVTLTCCDFWLRFSASDFLNDPVSELIALLAPDVRSGSRTVLFRLEPAAYQIMVTAKNGCDIFEIGYLDEYRFNSASFPVIFRMAAELRAILHPFRLALTRFATLSPLPGSWRHTPDFSHVKFRGK